MATFSGETNRDNRFAHGFGLVETSDTARAAAKSDARDNPADGPPAGTALPTPEQASEAVGGRRDLVQDPASGGTGDQSVLNFEAETDQTASGEPSPTPETADDGPAGRSGSIDPPRRERGNRA